MLGASTYETIELDAQLDSDDGCMQTKPVFVRGTAELAGSFFMARTVSSQEH